MSKIIELLAKYIGLPLLEKFGKWVFSQVKKEIEKRKVIKEQKKKEQAVENAKTPNDIRTSFRNNKL